MNIKFLKNQDNSTNVAGCEEPSRLQSLYGIVLAFICAILAELVFRWTELPASYMVALARISACFIIIYAIHRFALRSLKLYSPCFTDLITLSVVLVGSILLVGFSNVFAIGISTYADSTPSLLPVAITPFLFCVPYTSGALILQAILGLHYGLVFTLCFSFIMGIYYYDLPMLVPYIFVSCLVACLSLTRFRSRSDYVKAGFNVVLVSIPFAIASLTLQSHATPQDMLLTAVAPFIAAGLATFIMAGIAPVIEHFGGYVTDLRLIEMATLDHPLLKAMSIQAPGTWNHSMVLGMMVEAAADAVGANKVLARVGAYFHDIGKITKPIYFVENQRPGENPHDRLSTSMSALIIRSHVKDGIELARQHKLPKPIEEMIPQHHGTSLITFFYNKALKEAEAEQGTRIEVDKSLYSYPGPKPQSKEAGILMLADGIEAATRTLPDPSQDKIQGLVLKMINKVFASGELDECELTLADLHAIAKCFTRVLGGIYHQRISYQETDEKNLSKETPTEFEEEKISQTELSNPTQVDGAPNVKGAKKTRKAKSKEDKATSSEDLKRLGLQ